MDYKKILEDQIEVLINENKQPFSTKSENALTIIQLINAAKEFKVNANIKFNIEAEISKQIKEICNLKFEMKDIEKKTTEIISRLDKMNCL
jgi:hypothetical protein